MIYFIYVISDTFLAFLGSYSFGLPNMHTPHAHLHINNVGWNKSVGMGVR